MNTVKRASQVVFFRQIVVCSKCTSKWACTLYRTVLCAHFYWINCVQCTSLNDSFWIALLKCCSIENIWPSVLVASKYLIYEIKNEIEWLKFSRNMGHKLVHTLAYIFVHFNFHRVNLCSMERCGSFLGAKLCCSLFTFLVLSLTFGLTVFLIK